MGEVYRATDTRLDREVAIKVLPAALAGDADRLARFEREAKLLAALNHSNIAHVYGFEQATLADGSTVHFLAMELVEGEDLSQRLKRGAIPVDECVAIARQIAEALEEAHDKGIVHRDLKPANVKVTPDGKVKVLDFGLAKAFAADPMASSGSHDLSQSPTLAAAAGTQAGIILGTAAYMSPEQARGKAVDRRADIWAFGVVLFEMLTGRRLFDGETVSDVLAAVLTREPDWAALPPSLPAGVEALLRRCLERDPKQRLRDVGEARLALARVAAGEAITSSGFRAVAAVEAPSRRRFVPQALALLAVAAVASVATLALVGRGDDGRAGARRLTAFGVLVPEGRFLPRSQSPLLDLAADGRTLVFLAEGDDGTGVFTRAIDRLEVRRLAGSDGAEHPALSPDGRWVAFFAGGQLRKLPLEGGTALSLAEGRAPRGVAWMPDGGSLVYSPAYSSALWRVPATGGGAKEVTQLDSARGERSHRWPAPLPDGRTVLFTVGEASRPGDYDDGRIDAVRLDSGERRTVLERARMARYSATGHLVFQRRGALLAVRFDASRLETSGEPFVLHEGTAGETSSGAGYFAVSATGLLAFAPESAIPSERALVLVDREGRETELAVQPAAFNNPRFSPDGRSLAFGQGTASGADDDVFVMDLATQRVRRLTFGQGHGIPTWSPDGRRIVYLNGRAGAATGLAWKAADGSGEEALLAQHATKQFIANSWTPDGRLAVTDTGGAFDAVLLDPATGQIEPIRADPATSEYAPAFSPDGRFVAYTSTETGVDEVFVETFPTGGGKWQVSSDGGNCPVWSRDSRELYYAADEAIYAVAVDTKTVFQADPPKLLFRGPYDLRLMPVRNHDVGPDGRFALVKRRFLSGRPHELVVFDGWPSLEPTAAIPR